MFIARILCRHPNSGAAWFAGAAASSALTADLAGLTKAKMPEGRARALSGPERDETSKEVRRRRGTGFRFRPPLRRRPTASVFTECCISATTGHSLCGRWDASLGTPELPQPCRSSAEIARRDAERDQFDPIVENGNSTGSPSMVQLGNYASCDRLLARG